MMEIVVLVSVPSRCEVDAMHKGLDVSIYAKPELFPSPTEVNRFLYTNSFGFRKGFRCVSVPSRGR